MFRFGSWSAMSFWFRVPLRHLMNQFPAILPEQRDRGYHIEKSALSRGGFGAMKTSLLELLANPWILGA